jgi:hypothetical protein
MTAGRPLWCQPPPCLALASDPLETGKVDAAIKPSMYRFTCGSPIYIDANRVGEMDQIKCHIKEYKENNNYYYPLNKVQFNV